MNGDKLIIAIDFDGTIVEDAYPKIGEPKIFAFETLKRLQKDGHRLILWTYRCNTKLEEAVEFCRAHGIEFYAVNSNFPEEEFNGEVSRKIYADLFIDDRNMGPTYGWGEIYQKLTNETPNLKSSKRKKGWLSFLFK